MSETRKLAAILAADIVGYSRLAGADEARTRSHNRVHHGASSSAPDTFEFIWDKTPQKSHLRALPYSECPALFARMIAIGSTTALALAYLMLCGSRSGDALGARWSEIDDDAPIWEIPVTRMKNGKSHVVPLTDPALGILKIMRERHPSSDYLFPADHGGRLSNRALESLIHPELNLPCSVHGFRSSLRDWLGQRDRHAARDVRGNFVAHRLRVEAHVDGPARPKRSGRRWSCGRPISPKNVSSLI